MPTIEIEIPYTPGLSKNEKSKWARGHYYTSKEYSSSVESLRQLVWGKAQGQKWKKEKILVEIFLQKPKQLIDVANFVDSICDAIKNGIMVDDCWYSVKADWEYDKDIKPYILITISQDE